MQPFLTFTPPQLPQMMSGAQQSEFVRGLYPELPVQDAHLRDLSAAMDAYEFTRREYQARNAHYGEWMQWYRNNPAQKHKVVAFATEHSVCFGLARTALQMIAGAMGRLIEAWGDRENLSSISAVVANGERDAKQLAENLESIVSAPGPSSQSQLLPQKRTVSAP